MGLKQRKSFQKLADACKNKIEKFRKPLISAKHSSVSC